VNHSNRAATRNTIGLDISDRMSTYYMIDHEGEFVGEGRIPSTPAAFQKHFGSLPHALVALETGTHSRWASQTISKCGHEVIVGHARELKPIFETMKKTDPADAQKLARLARVDRRILHPIDLRSEEAQVDLAVYRARSTLVEVRTKLILHVRGTVKPLGSRIPDCSAPAFRNKAAEAIPEALVPALQPILVTIGELTDRIREYDRQIEELSERKYPETQLLRQVPGVGPITALAYVLTVGNPRRFSDSRSLGAYFGLTPRQDESGDSCPQLRISKAGDSSMRVLLVSAAHYILGPFGPDTDLRRFGQALSKRGGKNAKKRAVVAVARKIAVLLHRLWITGEVYRPLRARREPQATRQGA
jgi:transposase